MKKELLRIIFYKKMSKYKDDRARINDTFEALWAAYSSSQRHYHDLTHINSMLNMMEQYRVHVNDEDTVFTAIWFHDAVYNTLKSNNEEKSAAWAEQFLTEMNVPKDRIEKVKRYILATKNHDTTTENDLALFLDFDLAILGADAVIYEVYAKQIRQEYSLYPGFLYNNGRRKVLKSLLSRSAIYSSELFSGLEQAARRNLQDELDGL